MYILCQWRTCENYGSAAQQLVRLPYARPIAAWWGIGSCTCDIESYLPKLGTVTKPLSGHVRLRLLVRHYMSKKEGDKSAARSMLFQQGSSQRHREAVIALHMHMHDHLLCSASPLAFGNRWRTIGKPLENHRNDTEIGLGGH